MAPSQTRSKVVKSLRGGQITIPAEFRKELEIGDNSLLRVTLTDDGELRVRPIDVAQETGGSPWLKELYDLFAPVRQRILDLGMEDAQIDEMIDQAVEEVRARRSATAVAEDKGDYR